ARRQYRSDPCGREIRLHEGFQVLHVRHLVGAAVDQPRHRPAGPH
ncbi:MAG: RNA polymerase sigma factor RpoD, partial [uncultured Friedmanniella sp.]